MPRGAGAAADTYVRTCACGRIQRNMRENHMITTRSTARKERARPGRASDAGCEDFEPENSPGASRGTPTCTAPALPTRDSLGPE